MNVQVVTPSKREESILKSPGTVYVVTEEDIRRYGWRDIKEILAAIPNIDFKYDWNWLQGGQRGFTGSFSGTLLLIDGREVNNILAGEAFMANNYPSHRIKRVEITMGPSSAVYGSHAMQGVINIITKTAGARQEDVAEAEAIVGDGMKAAVALHVGNLLDSAYYHGNSRGTSPYQYLQAPRNYRLTASLKF